MKVYWVTPIAKSLEQAMEEVNASSKQNKEIKETFEKCLLSQFSEFNDGTSSKTSSGAGK